MSKINKNSLCYWFPLLEKYRSEINYPISVIYPLTHLNPLDLIENKSAIQSFITNDMPKIEPIFRLLGFPLFMKTDEFSGKHSWDQTCFIPNRKAFLPHLARLIEESECADIMGLPLNALVFRQFIPLESPFTFFHGNMPVAKERRYFIKNGKILCHHPYWDKDVFVQYMRDYPNTFDPEKLTLIDQLNTETPEEVEIISNYCKIILPLFPEYWSVDFAYGQDRKWYLIDMARGKDSWHPPCFKAKSQGGNISTQFMK